MSNSWPVTAKIVSPKIGYRSHSFDPSLWLTVFSKCMKYIRQSNTYGQRPVTEWRKWPIPASSLSDRPTPVGVCDLGSISMSGYNSEMLVKSGSGYQAKLSNRTHLIQIRIDSNRAVRWQIPNWSITETYVFWFYCHWSNFTGNVASPHIL